MDENIKKNVNHKNFYRRNKANFSAEAFGKDCKHDGSNDSTKCTMGDVSSDNRMRPTNFAIKINRQND